MSRPIRFDRHELAGAFGDIGTDLPLIVGMILATNLDAASVFIVFGVLQIVTGLVYRMPMPMQPLKAMAVLVITKGIPAEALLGAGFAIGAIMLVLSATGALDWLARVTPLCVVRGIQFGLGLSLASLALKTYVPALGAAGYAIALAGFLVMIALRGNRRVPAGLALIAAGVLYALFFRVDHAAIASGVGIALPKPHVPRIDDIVTGLFALSLAQLPLSISNSVIATRQTVHDLFPGSGITTRKIGLTYGAINLAAPFVSGIPVCHGCGGLAGHYAFGARTGGSVILYGSLYVAIGLFFSRVFQHVIEVFPQPILGVVLVFEALALMLFVKDQLGSRRDLSIAFLTALAAFALPQGYLVGILLGSAVYYLGNRLGRAEDAVA